MTSLSEDTRWLDATAQAELVVAGEAKASELVEAAIERIEADDGPINAVVVRWYDHAREIAEQAAGSGGPFAGVPFLLKDLYAHYEGQVLTNGNVALKEAQPVSAGDTTLVSRFRDAGLVTLGRTNSPELG
ncbi:MAG: amidase, partial [Ilumatobacter sp.]|nr:amidase [Ilumatobacter sp.]